MEQLIHEIKSLAMDEIIRGVLLFLLSSFVFPSVLYCISLIRRVLRKITLLEHERQANEFALVKVLNGKAEEFLKYKKEFLHDFYDKEKFLDMPSSWKIK